MEVVEEGGAEEATDGAARMTQRKHGRGDEGVGRVEAASAEEVAVEAADSADTAATTRKRKKQKRTGKKQGGKLKNAGKFRAQRRDRGDGDGRGAGIHTAPTP